jgi:Zn-dependent protease with chaperone function
MREEAGPRAPIELAPTRNATARRLGAWIRTGARWLHLALALAVVLAVFLQVYLIGAYIFGAGQGALDAHKTAGYTAHGFEVLVFVAALIAWLSWRDLVLSLLLAVVGTVQLALASEHRWVGGLHPLLALVVLSLAAILAWRGSPRRRRPA